MSNRVIVVDPEEATREVTARRLRAQGYVVEGAADPAAGADMALASPPVAVVADLWMPTVSGVQLCRLLRSEPATAAIAILLCGDSDEPKNRFWAERAGANAYVSKHRTGELVRTLARAVEACPPQEAFFFQLAGGTGAVRDRIARYLDEALFDSVIAAEVRALAASGTFDRLFDLFVQFLSQVAHYRWVALSVDSPGWFGVHHPPSLRDAAEEEARAALRPQDGVETFRIEDEDAFACPAPASPILWKIPFGAADIGTIALSPRSVEEGEAARKLLSLIARELAGPVRITSLMEEAQRLASTDPLTGLSNRRAFTAAMETELLRCARHGYPLSIAVLDVDHFKQVNDRLGHGAGDTVLAELGGLLRGPILRRTDLAARWGGEEFVVAYLSTPEEGALLAAERLRKAVEALSVRHGGGQRIPVTVSAGVAELLPGESLDGLVARADKAMYASKTGGRNRVTAAGAATARPRASGSTVPRRVGSPSGSPVHEGD